jgi:hypothetical protein
MERIPLHTNLTRWPELQEAIHFSRVTLFSICRDGLTLLAYQGRDGETF